MDWSECIVNCMINADSYLLLYWTQQVSIDIRLQPVNFSLFYWRSVINTRKCVFLIRMCIVSSSLRSLMIILLFLYKLRNIVYCLCKFWVMFSFFYIVPIINVSFPQNVFFLTEFLLWMITCLNFAILTQLSREVCNLGAFLRDLL